MPLGRVAGIPLRAHWSVLVLVVLLTLLLGYDFLPAVVPGATTAAYVLTAFTFVALLCASLLAHELAHAVLARRFGVRVDGITLWVLGGVTAFDHQPRSPRVSALVAAAGPVTSLVLGGAFLVATSLTSAALLGGLLVAGLVWLALTNLLIGVFNLLPAVPLDGGRLLHAWLWHRSGDKERATARAAKVGQVVGYVLIGLGFAEMSAGAVLTGVWLGVVGWFIASFALVEVRQGEVAAGLVGLLVHEVMTVDPAVAPGWWTVDAFADHMARTAVRHRAFPVVDFNRVPVGVVTHRELAAARTATLVQDVARPLSPHTVVRSGELLTAVLQRAVLRNEQDLLLVVDDGSLVGVVTTADIRRAVKTRRFRPPPAGTPG